MRYDSIFGPTEAGVPNPFVPHYHPWPTRYHGPRWMDIRAGGQYMEAPYRVGERTLAELSGCGACGVSPDGIGEVGDDTAVSGALLRAGAGVVIGLGASYLGLAPSKAPLAYAALGGLSAWAFGPFALLGTLAALALRGPTGRVS